MNKKELLKILYAQKDWAYDQRAERCQLFPVGSGVFRYWTGYISGIEFCIEELEKTD